jgi:phage-related protein
MMKPQFKPIVWLGNSLDVVRDWPMATRKRAGEELYRLQIGSEPLHWRGIKSVGRGVREIKISESGEHRVFYVVRRDEGIVVLHAFEKKTQRTAKSDIDLGKKRLKSGE